MPKHPDYPHVSSFTDRHGKTRWRFRKAGHKDTVIPGEPHSAEFDAAYEAIVGGRPAKTNVILLAGGVRPRSIKHAYKLLKESGAWLKLDFSTRDRYGRLIETLLTRKAGSEIIGDGPLAEVKRTHVKQWLQFHKDTPTMQKIMLICISKLIMIGIENEWITADPTYKMMKDNRHDTDGHATWTPEQCDQFEQFYPLGSTPRVAFALGVWLGLRASDIARLRWDHLTTKRMIINGEERTVEGFEILPFKGRKKKKGQTVFLPITPELAHELAPLSRDTDFVLLSSWKRGYSPRTLSGRMIQWVRAAGLPAGRLAGDLALSCHGLRKALGMRMAETGASTREMMDVLGHNSPSQAELYSRKARQVHLAINAMDKVAAGEAKRRKAPGLKIVK